MKAFHFSDLPGRVDVGVVPAKDHSLTWVDVVVALGMPLVLFAALVLL